MPRIAVGSVLGRRHYQLLDASFFAAELSVSSLEWLQFARSWERLPQEKNFTSAGQTRMWRRNVTYSRQTKSIWGLDIGDNETVKSRAIRNIISAVTKHPAISEKMNDLAIEIIQRRTLCNVKESGRFLPEGYRCSPGLFIEMLVNQYNIRGARTMMYSSGLKHIATHTLERPGDLLFMDHRKVKREITLISPRIPLLNGWRDTLVLNVTPAVRKIRELETKEL